MSHRFRMSDTEMEESPPTIAYALIVLLSAIYSFDIMVDGDEVVIQDEDTEMVMATLEVTPVFGELLVAILQRANIEISESQWTNRSFPS